MKVVIHKYGVCHLICILLPKHLLLTQTEKNVLTKKLKIKI